MIMKASELKTKSVADLQQELLSLSKEQFGLRMQVATQQLSNTSQLTQGAPQHRARENGIDREGCAAMSATNLKRALTGTVVSNKMDKTVTVLVERKVKHPVLGKVVRVSKKYHAHDENNEFNQGDVVTIEETRPLSKTKTWRVSKLLEKAGEMYNCIN